MKKIDDFMNSVDYKVEHQIPSAFFTFVKKYFAYFSSFLLISILGVFVYQVLRERPYFLVTVIKSDLNQIEKHLAAIDKECNILSITPARAYIDFLNVEKFSGSMVGALNLAYPTKWKGPYMKRNPTLQGLFYEIVKTREGIYLVPGFGVKLPNGLIIGKHVEITHATPIAKMLQLGGQLNYKGEPLARKIKFVIGDWDTPSLTSSTYDSITKALKEFGDALPFVQNSSQKKQQTC